MNYIVSQEPSYAFKNWPNGTTNVLACLEFSFNVSAQYRNNVKTDETGCKAISIKVELKVS